MNMFARKQKTSSSQTDELNRKKSASKVLDLKKDLNSRLRYLKVYIDSCENVIELKQFFDANYSQIYFLFYESFVNVETNIKQKLNKMNKEELETILYIFQKILILQPERLHQRWQVRSIGRIIKKLLHMGNTKLIKFYGIRLFLIWYQILNVNKTHVEELMFQKLIQGFDTFHSSVQLSGGILTSTIGIDMLNAEAQKVFNQYDNSFSSNSSQSGRSLYPFEITPIIPLQPNEQMNEISTQTSTSGLSSSSSQQQNQLLNQNNQSVYNLTAEMLRKMLEYMQQDCLTIEWYGDKLQQSQKCYEFLFDEFKRFYLAYMFPSAFIINSVRHLQYNPIQQQQQQQQQQNLTSLNVYSNVDLLALLSEQQIPNFEHRLGNLMIQSQTDERKLAQLHCKEEIIKWLISVLLIDQTNSTATSNNQINSISTTASYISINSSVNNPSIVSTSGTNSILLGQVSSNNNNNNTNMSSSVSVTGVNQFSYNSSSSLNNNNNTITNGNNDMISSSGYGDSNSSIRLGDTDTLGYSQDDLMSSISDIESNLFDINSVTSSSTTTLTNVATPTSTNSTTSSTTSNINKQLIQKVILSTMSNVNLVHEILRNVYFLNFDDYTTIQRVLSAYKKWFLKEAKMPSFMQEALPNGYHHSQQQQQQQQLNTPVFTNDNLDSSSMSATSIIDDDRSNWSSNNFNDEQHFRNQSNYTNYLEQTRIGYIRCLQIFFYHSSNLLLNRQNLRDRDRIKNVCCYTLEIYKLFIRKIKMDQTTWNLLITILLRITDFLFNSEYLSSNRNDPSTSHLIKLITETCLLAIIKASFSFNLHSDLWNQLMSLLSSFNSNPDVVDKWLEVIDDLIRQVFKSSYNIDINNYLCLNENLDQKRKLKKKYNTNNSSTTTATPTSISNSSPSNGKNSITSLMMQQQQQQRIVNQPLKSRAKTEIYSPSVLSSIIPQQSSAPLSPANSPLTIVNNNNLQQKNNLNNQITSTSATPLSINHTSNTANTSNLSSPTKSVSNITNQVNGSNISGGSTSNINSNSVSAKPLLTRQRIMTINDIDSTKSPSLRDEHFLAINTDSPSSSAAATLAAVAISAANKKSSSTIASPTQSRSQTASTTSPNHDNTTAKLYSSPKSQQHSQSLNLNDNHPDENNPNTIGTDLYDSDSSKSTTLKASDSTNQTNDKIINRFNSDKSIYYSSEILNENNGTSSNQIENNETNESNNNSSNNSNNISNKLSPPPLPPLPSQQPPPLPPLPPSLASKYKTILLDQEQIQNKLSNITINESSSTPPPPLPQQPPPLPPLPSGLDQIDNGVVEMNRINERRLKGMSTCSELDVYFKDYMNGAGPQIDTNSSEAASISGGELSGDTFASPILNANILSSNQNDLIEIPAASSTQTGGLLMQTNGNNQNNTSDLGGFLNSTISSNNTTNGGCDKSDSVNSNSFNSGLLSLDSRNDERSASFIHDSKFLDIGKDQSSKASTLTQNTVMPISDTPPSQINTSQQINQTQMNQTTTVSATNNNLEVQSTSINILTLIKRLFGCLGNVNTIKDPLIHKKIFEFIYNKWERLGKIKEDLKLNDISQIILPLSHFAPWLFESIYQLSYNYQIGKLIAYKTLCRMVIRSATTSASNLYTGNDFDSVSDEFMDLFYMTIHQGLRSEDKSITNCIIQNCGTKFWHCMIPSSTLLVKDFLDACANVDSQSPKLEAASILGCLIGFPDYFGDMKVLNYNSASSPSQNSSPSIVNNKQLDENLSIDFYTKEELKNLIVQSITNFSDDYLNTNSRCVILCALTCFIYDQILNHKWHHQRLNDSIKRIFKDLDFKDSFNPVLVKMSCDNLRFLSILANVIFQNEIQYAINIINELNQCLVKLINNKPANINDDYEKAIIANMFALLEWCMNMPLDQLKDQDRATLLRNNFKLILHISSTFKPNESIESEHIHLSARFIISHLLNQLNHFPFGAAGPTKIVSSVNETSDLGINLDELSPVLFEQPNIQFFTVNNQFLISFVELPMKNNEKYFSINPKLKTSSTICRFVIRDFCGKNCWDCCLLHSPDESLPINYFLDIPFKKSSIKPSNENSNSNIIEEENVINVSDLKIDSSPTNKNDSPNKRSVNFDFTRLPFLNKEDIPKDIDILDNILQYVSYSSPECRHDSARPLNLIWDLNNHVATLFNIDEAKQKIINQNSNENSHSSMQHENEMQQLENKKLNFSTTSKNQNHNQTSSSCSNDQHAIQSYFHLCKSFIHQIGLLSWEKRQSFNLLRKSPQLLRELKSLDDQTCRETHKIAIIYIAEGQEERSSILSNESGSNDYEEFLSALAWTIDLETHEGFMGGLQHNYQLKTAPYYANSICEVLFHVSTQMNNPNDQNKIGKWRHMGNDSVQIIWSEHFKDYDRNILATEFADVIICIYPLKNCGLFRIQIIKKSSVGFFGPLFDGAIVNKQSLPTLIRATAINASRVLLSNTKGYQDFYVHRTHAINNIIRTLTEKQTSEQFIADIYSPAVISQLIKRDNLMMNQDFNNIDYNIR